MEDEEEKDDDEDEDKDEDDDEYDEELDDEHENKKGKDGGLFQKIKFIWNKLSDDTDTIIKDLAKK